MAEWQRTNTCGELRDEHVGQSVTLNGWVLITRNYAKQVFVDLRDRYGLTQIVFEADDAELFKQANALAREWVVSITGLVRKRLPGMERDIPTGHIEVEAKTLRVLNPSPPLPFSVTEFPDEEPANEDLRLQYRYLDLRRRSLQRILILRHRINKVIRDHLDARGFLELETPLLGKSTPEGARDYLVPSRVFNGEFFALPQSPQLYKQLLMIAGYDKYFQIARCLRDEDLRADRQPEFTQLDLEMSFVEQDDVLGVIESLTVEVFQQCLGVTIPMPLPRLKYTDAMAKYGSDKPDLRFGLEIVDVTDIANASDATFLKEAVAAGGVVRAINAKGAADKFSNTALKPGGELPKVAFTFKAKGLAFLKAEADKLTGSIEKFFPDALKAQLKERLGVQPGDLLLFVADSEAVVCDALGGIRTYLANKLGLVANSTAFKFAWIVDFPMFAWDDEEKRWAALHHPFTSPRDEDLHLLESDPGKVRAKAYDLVLNGYEVGGGSIRIHRQEVQNTVFKMLGMGQEEAKARFGFLLDALQSGAPPHGGIALGLDRWAMLLAGTSNIRDVIAFPKNQKARDLMTGAPATVDARQLKDLGIKLA
ncbi:MAG TPA: aspartate--tRNA ligase [Urbifossiella sp.]|nr:aspartate--tRNA ligase [Urbifossiella sp.]